MSIEFRIAISLQDNWSIAVRCLVMFCLREEELALRNCIVGTEMVFLQCECRGAFSEQLHGCHHFQLSQLQEEKNVKN